MCVCVVCDVCLTFFLLFSASARLPQNQIFDFFQFYTVSQTTHQGRNMGSFLDKPVTTKFTEFRETKDFVWVVASMQGWRAEMEDAHTCISEERDAAQHHFFGMFDGHGGKNAAKLSAKGLYDKVRDNFKTDSTEDPLYEAKKCGAAVRFRRTLSLPYYPKLTNTLTTAGQIIQGF